MSALRGDPQIAPQEIFSTSTTQNTDIGARFTTGDGRVFRYVYGSGTALVAGKVYQAPAQDTSNWQALGVNPAAGTGTFVVTTGSSITLAANQMSGGLLTVRTSAGSQWGYGIKGHPSVSSGTVAFTLSDAIQVNIPTTAQIDVTPNPYYGVVIAPTTLTGTPLGVAVANGTTNVYQWIQTRGLCNVLSDGAITVGNPCQVSNAVSGALATAGGTMAQVAVAAITTVNAKYQPFFLEFE